MTNKNVSKIFTQLKFLMIDFDWNWKFLILLTKIEIFPRFWLGIFDWSEDFYAFFCKFKKNGDFFEIYNCDINFSK